MKRPIPPHQNRVAARISCKHCGLEGQYEDLRNYFYCVPTGYRFKWLCNDCEQLRQEARAFRRDLDAFTRKQFECLVEKIGSICPRCFDTCIDFTIDHVLPVSRGGRNNIENLQPLCWQCNKRKGNRETIDYIKELR